MLTVGDLFSGSGGMSWGFHVNPNFKIIGAADAEYAKPSSKGKASTKCNLTYEAAMGIKPNNVDLSVITPEELGQLWGVSSLDVLISCAPCTDFSKKNAENYVKDKERNLLVGRTFEFIEFFKPTFFIMENVPEMLEGKHKHHADELIKKLREDGYSVADDVHNLAEFGLPQLRHRALIIASKDEKASFPQATHTPDQFVTVREAIEHLCSPEWEIQYGQKHELDTIHRSPGSHDINVQRMKAIPKDGGSWNSLPEHLLINSMRNRRKGSYPDIYGRMWWDQPARTITRECGNLGNGRYLHPESNRLVSVREMSILQGFPKDYPFKGSTANMYNQIGDSVPPLVSKIVAEHVLSLSSKHDYSQTITKQ